MEESLLRVPAVETCSRSAFNFGSSVPDKQSFDWQDFGQHGREPITCEVALQLLRVLAGEADLPPGVDELILRGLLKQIVIKVSGMGTISGGSRECHAAVGECYS